MHRMRRKFTTAAGGVAIAALAVAAIVSLPESDASFSATSSATVRISMGTWAEDPASPHQDVVAALADDSALVVAPEIKESDEEVRPAPVSTLDDEVPLPGEEGELLPPTIPEPAPSEQVPTPSIPEEGAHVSPVDPQPVTEQTPTLPQQQDAVVDGGGMPPTPSAPYPVCIYDRVEGVQGEWRLDGANNSPEQLGCCQTPDGEFQPDGCDQLPQPGNG